MTYRFCNRCVAIHDIPDEGCTRELPDPDREPTPMLQSVPVEKEPYRVPMIICDGCKGIRQFDWSYVDECTCIDPAFEKGYR